VSKDLLVFIKLRWAFSDDVLVLIYMAIRNSPDELSTAGCASQTASHRSGSQVERSFLPWRVSVERTDDPQQCKLCGFRTPLDLLILCNGGVKESFRKIIAQGGNFSPLVLDKESLCSSPEHF
jgi:hypothetical protein